MNIEQLLSRLSSIKIYVEEERKQPDGKVAIILRGKLPLFPSGAQERWYVLVLERGQTSADRSEIEGILRHFWHGSTPFFDDEIEPTGHNVDLVQPE